MSSFTQLHIPILYFSYIKQKKHLHIFCIVKLKGTDAVKFQKDKKFHKCLKSSPHDINFGLSLSYGYKKFGTQHTAQCFGYFQGAFVILELNSPSPHSLPLLLNKAARCSSKIHFLCSMKKKKKATERSLEQYEGE